MNVTNSAITSALSTMAANQSAHYKSNMRVSTGTLDRIGADAATMVQVSEGLASKVSGLGVVQREIDRGMSTIDVAIAAGEYVSDLLTDMKAIAVAGADASLDDAGRAALNENFMRLRDELGQIVNSASFNGLNLVNGSLAHVDVRVALGGNTSGSAPAQTNAYDQLNTQVNTLLDGSSAFDHIGTDGAVADRISTFMSDLKALDPNDSKFDKDSEKLAKDLSKDLETLATDAAGSDKDLKKVIKDEFKTLDDAIEDLVTESDFTATPPSPPSSGSTEVADTHTRVTAHDFSLSSGAVLVSKTDSFATADEASVILAKIDGSREAVDRSLANLGSSRRALEVQHEVTQRWSDTASATRSKLVDANLGKESARLAALDIREQLVAQTFSMANSTPEVMLGLFRQAAPGPESHASKPPE